MVKGPKRFGRFAEPSRAAVALLLLTLIPAWKAQAQFSYTNTNGTITITGYTGPGGNVAIPAMINGLPVTILGDHAFTDSSNLTGVSIPNSVTNIGDYTFNNCASLATVTFGDGVSSIGSFAFCACSKLASVTLPDSVIDIRDGLAPIGGAFGFCSSLTNITLGRSVTNIGDYAFVFCTGLRSITVPGHAARIGLGVFQYCSGLSNVFFQGNAPSAPPDLYYGNNTTVYYLPGSQGWGSTFGGAPTKLWNPQVLMNGSFGIQSTGFQFNIAGTADIPLLIEGSTNPVAGPWVSLRTCTLTNGLIPFSDPQSLNYAERFYRIRSP